MISGFGKYMEYDGWNRLSKIRSTNATGSVLAEYFYDHEGKRVLKRAYNVTGNGHNESTYYLNTRPADFIQVINTNGTIINETYIYLQDKLIAKIDTVGQRFFYHPDHLGSTTLVTNESGSVVEDLLYLPYGDILSGDELSRFTYNGQESDRESGFMDYGARQYDARFSRFIEPDPIISDPYNPQDLNRYSYTRNNPYKYVDPTGNIVNVATAIAGAGIGATVSALYSAASQYHSSGSVNFGEVGKNAVVGAIAGGIGGLTFGLGTAAISVGGFAELSAGQAVGLGAISGITSGRSAQLTSNILSGNSLSQNVLDPDAIVRDGIIGGVTGGLVKGLTNSLSKTISLQGNYPSSYKSQIQSANKFFAEQAPEYSFNEHSLNSVLGRIQQGRISSQEAVVDALKNGQKYYDPSYNNYVFIKNNVKVHVDTRTNSVRTVTDGGPKEFYTPVSSGSSSSSGGGS
ncbi:RHS repeat-associated core domain-containing protein [Candidatus Pacearchaeota archaeon]|nr:RHS repeat-associated core domain-containing protein [Candidatus Pacearchaeota archaeon]